MLFSAAKLQQIIDIRKYFCIFFENLNYLHVYAKFMHKKADALQSAAKKNNRFLDVPYSLLLFVPNR